MTLKSCTNPRDDTEYMNNVAIHNATALQPLITVSLNSNPTILILQNEKGFDDSLYQPFIPLMVTSELVASSQE
ncbi:hypothetical protein TNCV_2800591 [Trichonephila clavipes]|nr:hypothetical protein TNCV_2800591 [Trichonephila clavipes]